MPSATVDWVGQRISNDSYLAVQALNTGGMADLILGEDLRKGGSVVLKTPRLHSNAPVLLARFRQEMQTLKSLRHPHIMPLLDSGEHDGRPFMVLPYLDGGTLWDRTSEGQHRGIPSPAWFHHWLPSVASALDYLHGLRWLHRDVKPANIFFDKSNKPYLGDLGLAKSMQPGQEPAFTLLDKPAPGTPRYMAPEWLAGQIGDGRSDQFSLAVVLYEIMLGESPFPGDTPAQVRASQADPRPRSSDSYSALPPRLLAALKRGLALEPMDRFATCRQFTSEVLSSLSTAKSAASGPLTWSVWDEAASIETAPQGVTGVAETAPPAAFLLPTPPPLPVEPMPVPPLPVAPRPVPPPVPIEAVLEAHGILPAQQVEEVEPYIPVASRAATSKSGFLWGTAGMVLGAGGMLLFFLLGTPNSDRTIIIPHPREAEFRSLEGKLDKAIADLKKSEAAYQKIDQRLRDTNDELARLKPLPEEKDRLTQKLDEVEAKWADTKASLKMEADARIAEEKKALDLKAKVDELKQSEIDLQTSLKAESARCAELEKAARNRKKDDDSERDRYFKVLTDLNEARSLLARANDEKRIAEEKVREWQRNAEKAGGIVTPSGVKYIERVAGTGHPVEVGDFVGVLYTLAPEGGEIVETRMDRGDPRVIQIGAGNLKVKALEDGIVGMKLNGKRKITIPWALGFGDKGENAPEGHIPGFTNLTYEVELIGLKKRDFDGVDRILNPGRAPLNVKRLSTLKPTALKDPIRNRPCKFFELELEAKKSYIIETSDAEFDTYLRLLDSLGNQLAENDNGAGGTNARISYRPTKTGVYRIYCSSNRPDGNGAFTLSIRQQ